MRTFLACSAVEGSSKVIDQLEQLVRRRKPEAILFAGGLFARARPDESPGESASRHHQNMQLLERFFATLGATRTTVAAIPGPADTPLRAFLMAGMNARSQSPGVHAVHCTLLTARDVVISGIGGELTEVEDSGQPVVRCSRTTAEYFLQAFGAAAESKKILLLGSTPTGPLGGDTGNALAGDLIDSYHPKLCIVRGTSKGRGVQRVAHTTMVNPGSLSEGSAAWIDWSRESDEQVEMIDQLV